jgi:hypothetical protein
MRTFQQFLEATDEQIALQKQRQAAREAKGGKGAEGSSGTHFHQKSTDALKTTSTPQRVTTQPSSNVPHQGTKEKTKRVNQQGTGSLARNPKKIEADKAGQARSSFQTRTRPNYDDDPLAKASGQKYDRNSRTGVSSRGGALATTKPW